MKKIIGKLKLVTILMAVLVVAFFGLVLFNIKDMLFGAPFTVHAAADGSTINDSFLPITGSARHAKEISINNRIIGVDPQGNFADGVILSPGYNIVEVKEKDQFGKQKTTILHLVANPSPTVAQNDVTPYQR
jgi:hypothetical protein